MIFDFFDSLSCVLQDEYEDYRDILNIWNNKNYHVAFMPAITWNGGIFNLFDQKGGAEGKDMIWLIPAGQNGFFWLETMKHKIVDFYEKDKMDADVKLNYPDIDAEGFEECILLHSDDIQNDSYHTVLDANVILVHLSLSYGTDTIALILLDHQDNCWKKIIENYNVSLTWLVDSNRGMENYYTQTNLYQLMKSTSCMEVLPHLYFKGLYNKSEIPDAFRLIYSMLNLPDADGSDKWRSFSSVYEIDWSSLVDMAVNLKNVQTVPIENGNIHIYMGWKGNQEDIDLLAFCLNFNNVCVDGEDVVFYNNPVHNSGGIEILGCYSGDDDINYSEIGFMLDKIPTHIKKIAIVGSIFGKASTFCDIETLFVRVVKIEDHIAVEGEFDTREETKKEYAITEHFSSETAFLLAELCRNGNEWEFHVIGEGFDGGLAAICSYYGLKTY